MRDVYSFKKLIYETQYNNNNNNNTIAIDNITEKIKKINKKCQGERLPNLPVNISPVFRFTYTFELTVVLALPTVSFLHRRSSVHTVFTPLTCVEFRWRCAQGGVERQVPPVQTTSFACSTYSFTSNSVRVVEGIRGAVAVRLYGASRIIHTSFTARRVSPPTHSNLVKTKRRRWEKQPWERVRSILRAPSVRVPVHARTFARTVYAVNHSSSHRRSFFSRPCPTI